MEQERKKYVVAEEVKDAWFSSMAEVGKLMGLDPGKSWTNVAQATTTAATMKKFPKPEQGKLRVMVGYMGLNASARRQEYAARHGEAEEVCTLVADILKLV